MYKDADDWLERFKAAGFKLRVYEDKIGPEAGKPLSPECKALWAELQGLENKQRWDDVVKEAQARVGPIIGWADY